MKWLAAFLVLVALLVGAGVYWVTERLDRAVADAIEDTAGQVLGTEVRVGSVDLDLARGAATVRALQVANPKGERFAFSAEPAFRLGEITVAIDLDKLDLEDLGSAPIPLELVRVAATELNAEVTEAGINLDVLRRNIGSVDLETSAEPVRLEIARFEFEEGTLRADASAVGDEIRTLELPSLRLSNLHGTPEVVAERVLDAFLGAAVRQIARDRFSSEVEEQLESVKEKAADALRSLLGVEERE